MRLIGLLLFVMAAQLTQAAMPVEADTVKVITDARRVVVTKEGGSTAVTVTMPSDNGDLDYVYVSNVDSSSFSPGRWNLDFPFSGGSDDMRKVVPTVMRGMYWGWRFNYSDKGVVKNGFELGVSDVIGVEFRPWGPATRFRIGLGFGMLRYLAREGTVYSRQGDALAFTGAPEGCKVEHSRLDSWTFSVPFVFTQKVYKDLGFSLGATVNFNTYATASTKLTAGEQSSTVTHKGLNQRLLTVDFIATAGLVEGIGVYCRWSPVTAFQGAYGPAFRSVSVGLSLNF